MTGVWPARPRSPGPSGASPTVEDHERDGGRSSRRAASTIAAKDSASSDAPPTRAPSMSGCAISSRRCRASPSRRTGSAPASPPSPSNPRRGRARTRSPPGPLRGGDLARADRPDRLVGDDDLVQPLLRDLLEPLLDLVAQLALGVAALALVLGLADAQDRREAGVQRLDDLVLQRLSVSLKYSRRSGARGSTPSTSISASIGADTSPVNAPSRPRACSGRRPRRASRAPSRPSPAAR